MSWGRVGQDDANMARIVFRVSIATSDDRRS